MHGKGVGLFLVLSLLQLADAWLKKKAPPPPPPAPEPHPFGGLLVIGLVLTCWVLPAILLYIMRSSSATLPSADKAIAEEVARRSVNKALEMAR